MKYGTKPTTGKQEHLGISKMARTHSSSFLSATTKIGSTNLLAHSKVRTKESPVSIKDLPTQYLSKSLEKTFLRLKSSPVARDAYVHAEVVTALAHQIRSVRVQRGWSQLELAKKLGTTQTAVSRLEDPSYGKFTLKTLLDLSKVFDTGLQVKFVSFMSLLTETYFVKAKSRQIPSFEEESAQVFFYSSANKLPSKLFSQVSEDAMRIEIDLESKPSINMTILNLKNTEAQASHLTFIKNWSS